MFNIVQKHCGRKAKMQSKYSKISSKILKYLTEIKYNFKIKNKPLKALTTFFKRSIIPYGQGGVSTFKKEKTYVNGRNNQARKRKGLGACKKGNTANRIWRSAR